MLSPVVFLVFVCVFLPATATAVVGDGMIMTLPLERAFPTSHGVEVSQLKARDRVRHGRILQSSYGVVDFPVEGTYDPFLVGLYFTRVQLGSPPKEFYVQIDTGSDVMWVSCASCNGCPTSSGLQIQLDFFDPSSSSTARPISCSDQRCALGEQSSDSGCSTQNQCSYTFQYGDGSGTSGYYVADFMHFDTIVGNSLTSNSSAPVVFGCSTSQTGDLTKPDRAIDGIFGFGQQGLSVIAQLSSQRVTPNVFSHCLKGSNGGGGILVLGQIVEPNLVYTPLVPSQPHYNLNLQSIALNGQTMPISPEVFETSSNRGTIVDSGTTLAYLAEEAYDPFINAINQAVSQNVRPLVTKGNQCYLTTSSVGDIFPTVSLTFAGGATMVLRAADYLIQQNSIGGAAVWCMGFQKIPGQGLTILGANVFPSRRWDYNSKYFLSFSYTTLGSILTPTVFANLVLKDKIIVYDLAGQRVGWANYDCSQAVNVSATTSRGKTEYVNAGQIGNNSSPRSDSYKLLLSFILTSVLHVLVRGTNSIL